MHKLYIVKVGSTFPATKEKFGDFDQWTANTLNLEGVALEVVDAEYGACPPPKETCAGVVITGSHAMVTDNLPWCVSLQKWIESLLDAQIPMLGICFGHQLLAQVAGGRVGYHPQGKEIGTVRIQLLENSKEDPLFQALPESFLVHVTHAQTVLRLPQGAIRLAANDHEPHHAFRFGKCAWGVQFHPEYTGQIMRAYIREQAGELAQTGVDAASLLAAVVETPMAAQILIRFGQFVCNALADKASASGAFTADRQKR